MRLTPPPPALEWEALPASLRECGEIAAMRLSQALADAVLNASGRLVDQAGQALTPSERETWLAAADMARAMRIGLGDAFARCFQATYAEACRDGGRTLVADPDPEAVQDAGFDGRFRHFVAWDGLIKLNRCYAALLGNARLDPLYAPVGPRTIEGALLAALRAQPGNEAGKRKLLEFVYQEFLGRVNLLYRDLTSFMIALGFVETSSLRSEAAQAGPVPAAQATQDAHAVPVTDANDPLRGITPGVWMEYGKPGRTPHPLRLTWTSPKRSLFLWTTAEGGRSLCVGAKELAEALASGRARLLDAQPATPDSVDPNPGAAAGHARKIA